MNQPASGDQVGLVRLRGDGGVPAPGKRRSPQGRAVPKSWTFKRPPSCQSSWKKSACKTARSRAQLKVVGRDSGSPKATLRVWRRIFWCLSRVSCHFPEVFAILLPSLRKNMMPVCNWFAVGCCGPLLCGESSRIHVEHCWAKSRVEPLRIIHDVYASWDYAPYWEIMGSFLCVLGGVQGILELGLPFILVGASEKQCWNRVIIRDYNLAALVITGWIQRASTVWFCCARYLYKL